MYVLVDDHEIINDWDQQFADPYSAVSLVKNAPHYIYIL